MKKLSEVALNELQVNDRVQSDNTKRYGKIQEIIPREKTRRLEDAEIVIRWDSRADDEKEIPDSQCWHRWLNEVTYIGPSSL